MRTWGLLIISWSSHVVWVNAVSGGQLTDLSEIKETANPGLGYPNDGEVEMQTLTFELPLR